MQGYDIDRYRTEAGWEQNCVHCGKRFEAKRADASFCDPRCRKAQQREVEKWEKWIAEMDLKGGELVNVAKSFKRSKRMFGVFLKLQRDLKIAIEQFEDV